MKKIQILGWNNLNLKSYIDFLKIRVPSFEKNFNKNKTKIQFPIIIELMQEISVDNSPNIVTGLDFPCDEMPVYCFEYSVLDENEN